MKELDLKTKEAIEDFFNGETEIPTVEKTMVSYVDELGNEARFKLNEGDVLRIDQLIFPDAEPIKKGGKKKAE